MNLFATSCLTDAQNFVKCIWTKLPSDPSVTSCSSDAKLWWNKNFIGCRDNPLGQRNFTDTIFLSFPVCQRSKNCAEMQIRRFPLAMLWSKLTTDGILSSQRSIPLQGPSNGSSSHECTSHDFALHLVTNTFQAITSHQKTWPPHQMTWHNTSLHNQPQYLAPLGNSRRLVHTHDVIVELFLCGTKIIPLYYFLFKVLGHAMSLRLWPT